MSKILDLIENEMSPRDVCVGLYEHIRSVQKQRPLDTDKLEYQILSHREGEPRTLKIAVSVDRYCGRGCHCYLDTTEENLLISEEFLTAYENYREHCLYWWPGDENAVSSEQAEYLTAAFEVLLSQYCESEKAPS